MERRRNTHTGTAAEKPSAMRAVMDIRETAEYLGLSEQTVRAEAKANRLPVVRIRGRILIVRALLDEMLVQRAKEHWIRD